MEILVMDLYGKKWNGCNDAVLGEERFSMVDIVQYIACWYLQ